MVRVWSEAVFYPAVHDEVNSGFVPVKVALNDNIDNISHNLEISIYNLIEMILTRLTILLALVALTGAITPSPALAAFQSNDDTCPDSYKIIRGDTLSKIAKRCGIALSALIVANPQIKNPSRIFSGQIITLPRRPTPAGEDSPTLVIRPKQDRLKPVEIDRLGIDIDSDERWIDVDLSSQTVSAYQGHNVAKTFLVSTGTWRYPTITGRFWIHSKYKLDDMRGPGYFLRDVPYTMYFYKGYGLHGTYWHDKFGTPMSHGCVNLAVEDARWLYSFAEIGTLVNVHP
jgi:lipoprotein-anchoring transpeptidase ErfK/SrfK